MAKNRISFGCAFEASLHWPMNSSILTDFVLLGPNGGLATVFQTTRSSPALTSVVAVAPGQSVDSDEGLTREAFLHCESLVSKQETEIE